MSANSYITSVPLFQGAQGSYYLVNGYKYHPCFPIHWAMNHKSFRQNHKTFRQGEHEAGSGPIDCSNCAAYGSIKGVFVGYCSNCLRNYLDAGIWRGVLVARGMDINDLQNLTIWMQYPYMYGIDKNEIGDKWIPPCDCCPYEDFYGSDNSDSENITPEMSSKNEEVIEKSYEDPYGSNDSDSENITPKMSSKNEEVIEKSCEENKPNPKKCFARKVVHKVEK